MEKHTGFVKWFNSRKGFGFIRSENDGQEVFVHFSAINSDGYRTLEEGDKVSFKVSKNDKGTIAEDVCVIANDAPEAEAAPEETAEAPSEEAEQAKAEEE